MISLVKPSRGARMSTWKPLDELFDYMESRRFVTTCRIIASFVINTSQIAMVTPIDHPFKGGTMSARYGWVEQSDASLKWGSFEDIVERDGRPHLMDWTYLQLMLGIWVFSGLFPWGPEMCARKSHCMSYRCLYWLREFEVFPQSALNGWALRCPHFWIRVWYNICL